MAKKNKNIDNVAMLLTFVGGINWGLVGLFNFNFVQTLFGGFSPFIVSGVYVAVGLSAGWLGFKSINK